MSEYALFNHVKTHFFTCGNLFSKNNGTWEFIFEEKVVFETSENENPSKITSCMALKIWEIAIGMYLHLINTI